MINYSFYLTTAYFCHSQTSSTIYVIIHGTKNTSGKLALFNNGIAKGDQVKVNLKLKDFGVILGVKVRSY